MTDQDLIAQFLATRQPTKLPRGKRGWTETQMYLLTEASDKEREDARIEDDLKRRQQVVRVKGKVVGK